ncbi:unnamed protein product, partial [Nippostrongylus brasiliensis]|uniref:FAT domain-containing protein n=1 Tax=Nippostrongylus brasiliensis TaxID=27835 RepID=A0A0N4YTN1_NIPBR
MNLNTTSSEFAAAVKLNGAQFVADLQWLLDRCDERFLTDTSKWVLEILTHCPESWLNDFGDSVGDCPSASTSVHPPTSTPSSIVTVGNRNLLFGKNLLVNRDFARASFFLKRTKLLGSVERFLYYWSRYQGCVRTHLENEAEAIDRKAVEHNDDSDYTKLLREIGQEPRPLDIFLLYLEGKIQASLGVTEAATSTMKEVLKMDSRFWPAWQELVSLIANVDEINVCKALCTRSPDSSWMADWFESLAL